MTNYSGVATGERGRIGREIMERKYLAGTASASAVIQRVQDQVPEDSLVPGRAFNLEPNEHGLSAVWFDRRTEKDKVQAIHKHALTQVAARAGVPSAFVTELAESPEEWRRALAAEVLNKHFHEMRDERTDDASRRTNLVRSVQGQVRGFLSDKYKRIDSRPTLDAFVAECQAVGAVPYEGIGSDVRVQMRAIIPTVFEPIPGEVVCFGAEWGNSDFGAAKLGVRVFMVRLLCTNGATLEDAMAQVHAGRRMGDDFEYSDRTMHLDTRASVSALRDVVRGLLGPRKIEENLALLARAGSESVSLQGGMRAITQRLTKGEAKLVTDAYKSADVINLPPGETTWRLSNALSWVANTEGLAQDRKVELQRMAGRVLNGKDDRATSEEA